MHTCTRMQPLFFLLFTSNPALFRRLSDSAGLDSEAGGPACTLSSLSDDGTAVAASPLSIDLPITTQGEEEDRKLVRASVVTERFRNKKMFVCADAVDAPLLSDLSADLLGLEAESWSLAVTAEFCRQHDRRTIKRQDVIYGEKSISFFPLSLSPHLLLQNSIVFNVCKHCMMYILHLYICSL